MGKLTRPKPNFEREPTTMDRPERIVHIQKKFGFMPRTNHEAAMVMALMGRPDSEYRVQGFLNEVYQRQLRLKKDKYFTAYQQLEQLEQQELYDDIPEVQLETQAQMAEQDMMGLIRSLSEQSEDMDPKASIRAIAHSFADNALAADDSLSRAVRLSYELDRSGVNAKLPFSEAIAIDEWSRDPNMVATLSDFTRHIETEAFIRDGKIDSIGKLTSVFAEKGEDRIARISKAIDGRSIADVQDTLFSIGDSEQNRRAFWTEQLVGATRHLYVRDVATTALNSLPLSH